MEVAPLAVRFAVAAVFVFAGLAKLRRTPELEHAIGRYELVPAGLARPLAVALPPAELAGGLMLASGAATRPVATLLAVALAIFSAAVAINLLRGREIECGCFGGAVPRRISWPLVARNLALACALLVVAADAPRALAVDALFTEESRAVSHVDGLAVLLSVTLAVALSAVAAEARRVRGLAIGRAGR